MAEEKKNLLNEIKGCLASGEFEEASDLCASFVETFPNCFNGWAYYILAECKARTVQELVNSDYTVQDLPIYAEAIKALDETERQKLIAWKEKIELAARRNGVNDDSCVAYFYGCLRKLKAEILALTEKRSQCIESDKAELKEIKKGSSSFFANNPIYFFAFCSVIALPFVFLAVYLTQLEVFWLLKFLPLIAVGVILILITVKKRKKRNGHKRGFLSHKESCDCNAAEIVALQAEIDEKTAGFKKLKVLYRKAKRRGVLSEKLEMQYRKKFDGIYNELAVNKREQ